MGPPTLWQHVRQVLGRALRETGQSLDRLGVKTATLAVTQRVYYDDPCVYEDHLSRHRHQFPLLRSGRPVIHHNVAYLAPCSSLIGSVYVGENASVWYGAVVKGDQCDNTESFRKTYKIEGGTADIEEPWPIDPDKRHKHADHYGGAVFIGRDTNIQDSCIVTARSRHCQIGNGVTVGHLAQIDSATIHDFCLIGMGSVVGEGVVVHEETLIGAGAVVAPRTVVGAGELWVGNPARKIRDLTAAERQRLHYQSSEYVQVAGTQRNVMKLGGNVNADGVSVHVIIEEELPQLGDAADGAEAAMQLTGGDNECRAPLPVDTLNGDMDSSRPTNQEAEEVQKENLQVLRQSMDAVNQVQSDAKR